MNTEGTEQITKCPKCKSENLNYNDIDNHEDGLVQDVECCKCGITWKEYFRFVRWELSE